MADNKQFTSIIDAMLADREPDWDALDMKDAKKSGEEVANWSHQYVDKDFQDEIAESASRHTPVPPTGKSATLNARLRDKEKAAPQITAVKANWHKDAYPREEDFRNTEVGDNDSLLSEALVSLEKAYNGGNLSENSADKKALSDAALQSYLRSLLNSGMAPSKVAQKIEKLAELELLNHQSATDYLQRNAGMLGLAYLEPNTFMDKQSPDYGIEGYGDRRQASDSKGCVQALNAMRRAGIEPRAKSVKQVKACAGCSYYAKDATGKRCNLYHLPIVANADELSQIVNNLTPGVPLKQKRAALVQIANRTDEHVQPFDAAKTAQTNIIKTADAKVSNQARRMQPKVAVFRMEHVAKLHGKGVPLKDIYRWADKKFGSVDTSVAFRGFVQSLRKDSRGRIVVAADDLKFLNAIGIRSEKFEAGSKCASCAAHFAHGARPAETDRGAMRVEGKFAQRTPEGIASRTEAVKAPATLTAAKVRALHQKGHSLEKVYKAAAPKVGSVEARKAILAYVASLKKVPGKIQVNASDYSFLGKLGMKPEALAHTRLAAVRPDASKVVANSGETPLLSYPGMNDPSRKTASTPATDGHAILKEYDLSGPAVQQDIDISGPDRLDVETKATFSLDE